MSMAALYGPDWRGESLEVGTLVKETLPCSRSNEGLGQRGNGDKDEKERRAFRVFQTICKIFKLDLRTYWGERNEGLSQGSELVIYKTALPLALARQTPCQPMKDGSTGRKRYSLRSVWERNLFYCPANTTQRSAEHFFPKISQPLVPLTGHSQLHYYWNLISF